jgi:hypothetical protein
MRTRPRGLVEITAVITTLSRLVGFLVGDAIEGTEILVR